MSSAPQLTDWDSLSTAGCTSFLYPLKENPAHKYPLTLPSWSETNQSTTTPVTRLEAHPLTSSKEFLTPFLILFFQNHMPDKSEAFLASNWQGKNLGEHKAQHSQDWPLCSFPAPSPHGYNCSALLYLSSRRNSNIKLTLLVQPKYHRQQVISSGRCKQQRQKRQENGFSINWINRFIKSYMPSLSSESVTNKYTQRAVTNPYPGALLSAWRNSFLKTFSWILAAKSLASSSLNNTLQARKESNNKLENAKQATNKLISPFLTHTYLCVDAHVRKNLVSSP